jgi:hypothetical protein
VRLEGLAQLKKSNNLIGNRNRDLPACSIVPRPTTLLHAPKVFARKPERKLQLRRHSRKWKNNIKMDIKEIGWEAMEWIHLAQYMDH